MTYPNKPTRSNNPNDNMYKDLTWTMFFYLLLHARSPTTTVRGVTKEALINMVELSDNTDSFVT